MKYYPMFDLVDDFFGTKGTNSIMKTDILEKDGNYELSMDLPGVAKEDIKMELKDGYLKVTAKHGSASEDKDENGRVIRRERVSGSYSRAFYIGDNVSQEDVKAKFENGVLQITIPKDVPEKVEETKYIQIA